MKTNLFEVNKTKQKEKNEQNQVNKVKIFFCSYCFRKKMVTISGGVASAGFSHSFNRTC